MIGTPRRSPTFVAGLVALAAMACSSPTSVRTQGSPPASLAGSWEIPTGGVNTPDGPWSFSLTQSGDSVSGTGGWADQVFSVTGTYVRPLVTLNFTITSGPGTGTQWQDAGRLVSATEMHVAGPASTDTTTFVKE